MNECQIKLFLNSIKKLRIFNVKNLIFANLARDKSLKIFAKYNSREN